MRLCIVLIALGNSLWADEKVHITGTVFRGASQQRISGARVYLTPAPARNGVEPLSVVTKGDGRFEFLVPAGKYQLTAETSEIYRQNFGGRKAPPEIGVSIIAQPGLPTEDLSFPLFPPASIRGRIVDAHGEPVENGLVQLLQSRVTAGRARTNSYRWAYTNDLGEFRFGLVPAGTYYLAVTAEPWYANGNSRWRQGRVSTNGGNAAFLTSYFPGTPESSQAAPLRLTSGQESKADFTLTETTGARISVACRGCPEGGALELIYDGIGHAEGFQQVTNIYNGHGTLSGVPPGHYIVRVRSKESTQARAAMAPVDVNGTDLSVDLNTAEMPAVSGIVSMEGGAAIPRGMTVSVRNITSLRITTSSVNPNGGFAIAGVLPGEYQILVGNSSGLYAKSVHLGEKEARVFTVSNDGVSNVRILAALGGGSINGLVYQDGKPTYGVLAVLVPEGLPNEPDLYHGFQTDSDGSFSWTNVRPGSYRLLAFPTGDFEYASTEKLRPYMKDGKLIEIGPGDVFREKIEVPVTLR
jgi:hypothetical protein